MSELHCMFLARHDDPAKHEQIETLVSAFKDGADETIEAFEEVFDFDAADRATAFFDQAHSDFGGVAIEGVGTEANVHFISLIGGSSGDNALEALVKLFSDHFPDGHFYGWGCGDDDPWEFWCKWDAGKVIRCDNGTGNASTYNTIYRWWHEGLPPEVRIGLLNDDDKKKLREKADAAFSQEAYVKWVEELRQQQ